MCRAYVDALKPFNTTFKITCVKISSDILYADGGKIAKAMPMGVDSAAELARRLSCDLA